MPSCGDAHNDGFDVERAQGIARLVKELYEPPRDVAESDQNDVDVHDANRRRV